MTKEFEEFRQHIAIEQLVGVGPYQSSRLAPVRNIVKRVFGCWHLKVSRPFTRGEETYQTCISCGARRRFDLDQWTSVGGFYYPKRQRE